LRFLSENAAFSFRKYQKRRFFLSSAENAEETRDGTVRKCQHTGTMTEENAAFSFRPKETSDGTDTERQKQKQIDRRTQTLSQNVEETNDGTGLNKIIGLFCKRDP